MCESYPKKKTFLLKSWKNFNAVVKMNVRLGEEAIVGKEENGEFQFSF